MTNRAKIHKFIRRLNRGYLIFQAKATCHMSYWLDDISTVLSPANDLLATKNYLLGHKNND